MQIGSRSSSALVFTCLNLLTYLAQGIHLALVGKSNIILAIFNLFSTMVKSIPCGR
jgi:hypothetical protein